MNYRRLGRSGLQVSELSLGSWTTYGGSVDDGTAIAIVHRAFELGINTFDTADVYVRGKAEEVLGKALRDLPREQVVVATKVMGRVWDGPLGAGLSRKHMFDAIDGSLRRLGLDYVDLYQLHAPDKNTPLDETLQSLEDLVRSGRVRYVGFSNFDRHPPLDRRALAMQKARGWERFVSSQPRYSLLDRHVEKGHMALCKANGVGLFVYSPLAQGVLSNKYAGGGRPEGSRATTSFAHFLTAERADRRERRGGRALRRVDAASRPRVARHRGAGVGPAPIRGIERHHRGDASRTARRERECDRTEAVGGRLARGRGRDRRAGEGARRRRPPGGEEAVGLAAGYRALGARPATVNARRAR